MEHDSDNLKAAVDSVDAYAATLDDESARYWELHRNRFRWTTAYIRQLLEEKSERDSILDIGNSFQTLLFSKAFPDLQIDTLGFLDHRYQVGRPSRHYAFDLNEAHNKANWIQTENRYDVIVFLEVIEHLYTSPSQVLAFLRTFLKSEGLIVIQTPNAAALKKRIKLLFGKNPYERIRETRENPGHFREYTAKELSSIAEKCGYETVFTRYNDFLIDGNRSDRRWDRIARWLPSGFKGGFTLALRRSD